MVLSNMYFQIFSFIYITMLIIIYFSKKRLNVEDGEFGRKKVIIFNIYQVIANATAWLLVAPALDVLIYAEPANKVFAQGFWAFLGNIIIIAILGTLLGVGYSKIGAKSSSLSKED